VEYWIKSADSDYDTMRVMYENKKNTWSLFIGHLVIEKLLKGLYAKNNEDSPYAIKSHNLLQLAEKCNTSTSYIGEIEIGKKFPSVEMISNISEALEIRPFELFMKESDYFVPTINPNLKKTLIQKISQVIEDTL
jgi:transcriptional regulator with XRE-family HTH domain